MVIFAGIALHLENGAALGLTQLYVTWPIHESTTEAKKESNSEVHDKTISDDAKSFVGLSNSQTRSRGSQTTWYCPRLPYLARS